MSSHLKAAFATAHPLNARSDEPSDAVLVARSGAGDVRAEEANYLRHVPVGLQEVAYLKLAEAYERAGHRLGSCAALARCAERFPRGTKAEAQRPRCQVERQP